MLRMLAGLPAGCPPEGRREVLRAGALSLLGISLPGLLRAEGAGSAASSPGKARSVILLNLFGGPAKHEMFDPKPDAPPEIRGPFQPIATTVPGVHFCELLPRMSEWMHRSTLIRSCSHTHNTHSGGLMHTMTGQFPTETKGHFPPQPTHAPSMNAVVQYLARSEVRELPASVWMPCYIGWGQNLVRPGPYAGFLGRQYDPLFTSCELYNKRGKVDFYDAAIAQGRVVLRDTQLHEGFTLDRMNRRQDLLEQFDSELQRMEQSGVIDQFDTWQSTAFRMLTSTSSPDSPWRAFDVEDEAAALRDRYGRNLYGQTALVARRLIERGVRFVTVSWESFVKDGVDPTGWDTHSRHFEIVKQFRTPVLDQLYSALCEDLQTRGLLDETLIIVMGEMGRTPKIAEGGRDHWSYCYDVLLTGAGVHHGAVYGASDKIGAWATSDPVEPRDIVATVYAALGIDTNAMIYDQEGRPHPIALHGQPIDDVLA